MSTENQFVLPDVQSATDTVFHGVHRRAFLHKLAQCGHRPETEAEADALVELGFKLASADPDSVVPADPFDGQVAPAMGKYAAASADLDAVLGLSKQGGDENMEAAFQLAQDPEIYAAALSIKSAEAEQVAAAQAAGA